MESVWKYKQVLILESPKILTLHYKSKSEAAADSSAHSSDCSNQQQQRQHRSAGVYAAGQLGIIEPSPCIDSEVVTSRWDLVCCRDDPLSMKKLMQRQLEERSRGKSTEVSTLDFKGLPWSRVCEPGRKEFFTVNRRGLAAGSQLQLLLLMLIQPL